MSTLSVPLLLPTADIPAHNRCAALKATLEKDGADLRWEVLPTLAFLLRLAESKAPLSMQSLGMFSAYSAILFQTPSLSSCPQVIMPVGGRGAEEDFIREQVTGLGAKYMHKTGTFMLMNLIKQNKG